MKPLLTLILLFSILPVFGAPSDGILDLFGTKVVYVGETPGVQSQIGEELKKISKLSPAYDPDCFYVPKGRPCDRPKTALPETLALDKTAEEMKKETDGAFDVVRTVESAPKRDFGGFAQGYVLDQIRAKVKGNYAINFAGDIFVSGPMKSPRPLSIDTPFLDGAPFTSVKMNSGWIIGSVSPKAGSEIVNPKTGKEVENADFVKVVLFAKPEFSGARLDAWSTSLIVGGRKLLEKLWEKKEYQGQWAWMYFESMDKAFCSPNIDCELKLGPGLNQVTLPW